MKKVRKISAMILVLILGMAFSIATITAAQDGGDGTASDFPNEQLAPPEQAGPIEPQTPGSGLLEIESCLIGDWQTVAPVNTGRSRTGVAYLEATGKFYMAGGEASGGNRNIPIEEYDPVADTWTNRSNLLTGVSNSGAAGVGQYVYVPGGYTGSLGTADMQRFDPLANAVTTVAPMPAGNYAHAVTALDGKIYVLGGSGTGAAGTTNYIYDIAADSWMTGTALLTAVQYPAAATDGTYVYVLGGNTTNLATVQRYDPVSDSWDTIADMTTGRGGPGAFFDGSNVWAVGGGWTTYLPSTEYWDGSSWQSGPALNVGARTIGAAFGGGIALKAAGWNGAYADAAEKLEISCYGMQLTSEDVDLSGGQGETLTYTLMVSNTGDVVDSYTLGVTGETWPTMLESSLVTVTAGSSIPVEVYVTIPADANDGDMDMATTTAASTNNSAITDSLVLTSTMTAIYGVDLTTDDADLSGDRGETLTYTLMVMNTGNVTDTYALNVSGETWLTVLETSLVEVAAGGSQTVEVYVTVPAGASDGDMDTATITATTTSDGTASDSLVLTSTAVVEGYFVNLPIVFKP